MRQQCSHVSVVYTVLHSQVYRKSTGIHRLKNTQIFYKINTFSFSSKKENSPEKAMLLLKWTEHQHLKNLEGYARLQTQQAIYKQTV
jgi:hypothetical protein